MTKLTVPEVFIIETLDPDDEGNGRFEGSIISQTLRLQGKNCRYKYVRTQKEFEKAVRQFGSSSYRYLHLSCHADRKGMITTNQDEISFDALAVILRPHLAKRRLFLSACEMAQPQLAKKIMHQSGCFSMIGPNKEVNFCDAAVFWAALYHLLFSENFNEMKQAQISPLLERTSSLFQLPIKYYTRSRTEDSGYREVPLRSSNKPTKTDTSLGKLKRRALQAP